MRNGGGADSTLSQASTTASSTVIYLRELTSVTREDLKPYCISLVTPAKTYYLALKSDEELYGWMDDIYSRSPLMGVSNPTNFVHQVHVGFDPVSGAFTGLPEQWTRLLTSSAITKEDYAKNPQAVLDVLEFYTDIQKRERDDYGLGTTSLGMTDGGGERREGRLASGGPPARFGAGTGLAGQRNDSLGGGNNLPALPPPAFPKSAYIPPPNLPYPSPPPLTRPPPATQSGFRQAPGPPPRDYNESAPASGGARDHPAPSARLNAPPRSAGARPNLVPGRAAPPTPASSVTAASSPLPHPSSAPGLKPLLTSSASRTNLKDSTSPYSSPRAPPASSKANGAVTLGTKPLQLSSGTKAIDPPPHLARPANPSSSFASAHPPSSSSSAPSAKPLQTVKKVEKTDGDRRVSTMSEAQIMAKLRSVCSPQDPSTLYSKIKKVGQGASGSVYVARVLANGSKVAIKQMDLSQQPRKELIVNEILVMKESQHPNIVNFLDSFLVKGAELWVVMEYMEGGALTDVIDSNSLEEDQISSISNEASLRALFSTFERLLTIRFVPSRRPAKGSSTFTRRASFIATSRATTFFSILRDTSRSVSSPSSPSQLLRPSDIPRLQLISDFAPSLPTRSRSERQWSARRIEIGRAHV